MSTIPFTLIQGSLALPRLRPLAQLPTPFGRDWSLLPPGYSVRAELRALYAAMLRTFCLSDDAMRALCHWLPLVESRHERAPEQTVSAAAIAEAASAPVAPRPVAAPLFETVRVARMPDSAKGSRTWVGVAGGVCALSGAAMLAWVVAGHFGHHQAGDGTASVAGTASEHGESATNFVAATGSGLAAPEAVPSAAPNHVEQKATPNKLASSPDFSVPAPRVALTPSANLRAGADTSIAAPAVTRAPVRQSDSLAVKPEARSAITRTAATPQKSNSIKKQATRARRHGAPATVKPAHRMVVAPLGIFSHVPLAPHAAARPSSAGGYSPLAPSRLGVDEYASVTMSAATPVQRIAPPSRVAPSVNASQAGNTTEWSNHMSQRRVTEVPDQFAR